MTVIEIASLGPGPFCAMLLADMGASVVRVERLEAGSSGDPAAAPLRPMERGRASIGVDLKAPGGPGVVLRLIDSADVLLEGFRPGVMERLGLGPEPCLERNPGLVYGRVTGYGRSGPLAGDAGHDIDYLALSGALHPMGRPAEPPAPPLNLVADFGGGGMLLAVGVLAALLERSRSGQGQVVDAAMVDGAALLTTMLHGMLAEGTWTPERGANLLDGGAPFYDVYPAADGGLVAVGAIEPQFFARLAEIIGIDPGQAGSHFDPAGWPSLRRAMADAFKTRTRDEWAALFAGEDACAAPVLTPQEAPRHPQLRDRATFVEVGGVTQPAPAPRFSRTPLPVPAPPRHPGADTGIVLAGFGFSEAEVEALRGSGTVG
jgi:alpha-methylacyl-CoA racemase